MYAAIYCRKSVSTQRGESMQSQLAICRGYLTAHRSEEIAADAWIYQDEGFSGAAMQRPAMQRLLGDVRARLISCVVCYRLDRISRSVADFTALMEEFSRFHVDFLCASEEFDTAKPMGRAMLYIASVFSQLERETLAERVRDNMYTLAADGRWLGGPPPYGFRIRRMPPPRPYSVLLPDAEEQETVRMIFSLFRAFRDVEQTEKAVTNFRSRTGKPFSVRYLRCILRNPVYAAADADAARFLQSQGWKIAFSPCEAEECGMLAFGKRPNSGAAEPLVTRGLHPALISGKEYAEIQYQLGFSKRSRLGVSGLLQQILRCGICGGEMFCKSRSGRNGQFDYICKRKARQKSCICANLNGNKADAATWKAVCDAMGFSAVVRAAGESDRRALLQICVEKAEWDGDSLRLTLRSR